MKFLMKKIIHKINFLVGCGLVSLTPFFFAPIVYAADATIFLAPITGTYITGKTFPIKIMVSSGGQAVNAIEGKIEFDPKEIEIMSVDSMHSALNSWTIAPVYDNAIGELSFAGSMATATVLARGEVLTVSVKGLRSGELHIRFATGSAGAELHAADGTGGNILSQLSGGVYVTRPEVNEPESLSQPAPVVNASSETTPIGEVLGAATGTEISSPTHPDQTLWYATSTAVLDWGIPVGVAHFYTALDKKKDGEGVVENSNTTHEKVIRDIKDGVWYFHLTKVMNDASKETLMYRIAVDTVAPKDVHVSEVARSIASDPTISIALSATDTLSGVDHYEFVLDGNSPSNWQDDGTHVHKLQGVAVGKHQLVVSAVDKAGNKLAGNVEFTIENLATPTISLVNNTFIEGDKIVLSLLSTPNTTLDIHISRANTSPITEEFTLDGTGKGTFTSAIPLQPGVYIVSALAHMPSGALSLESSQLSFDVNSSFIGVIKRHPMVPVAGGGIIVLTVVSIYFWRNFIKNSPEEYEDEDESYQQIEREELTQNPVRSAQVSSGAIVLEKKKKVELPATRL